MIVDNGGKMELMVRAQASYKAIGCKPGEWVFGYYVGDNVIRTTNKSNSSFIEGTKYIDIDPSTLGLKSGFFDKNHVAIYSGDILECEGYIGYVVFELGAFRFVWRRTGKKENDTFVSCNLNTFARRAQLRIKGNVHDNNMLLNKRK